MANETPPTLMKRFGAELIGTYLLVTFVIAAYFIALVSSGGALSYGVAYGVVLALLIVIFGRWSNQFNPIVSLVMFITRQQDATNMLVAIAGQIVGATAAAKTVQGLTNLAQGQIQAGVPTIVPESVSLTIVTMVEGFGILLLLLAYIYTAIETEKKGWLPILAGLSVIPGSLIAMVISGAALNPVRILGPAILAGSSAWKYHWVYWVGPLLAALVAVIFMGILLKDKKKA